MNIKKNNINTVVILCAGSGKRMGKYTENLHKALLPLNFKSILSNIIDSFPNNFNFVIPVGFQKKQIKYFCSNVHPNKKIKFVDIKKFSGKGSGPGYSLLRCKKYLNKPFYLISCDTLFKNIDLKADSKKRENWVGVSKKVLNLKTENYCCFKIKQKRVSKIYDKKKNKKNCYPFIGFCKIFDYKIFFKFLATRSYINNELQISNGLQGIINNNDLFFKKLEWKDFGSIENYKKNSLKAKNYDFSKTDEFLYLYKDKIVGKYFKDNNICKKRYERGKILKKVTPKMLSIGNNIYFYKWTKGNTLYENCNPKIFLRLLSFLNNNIWKKQKVDHFNTSCLNFYKNKTFNRVKLLKKKYNITDRNDIINGEKTISVKKLLNLVNWNFLSKGWACNFHGDLQFDNIIYSKNKFKLIDWRDSFDGRNKGDIYYDFAKLLGGIDLNYKFIKKGDFEFKKASNKIFIKLKSFRYQSKYRKILENFIIKKGFDIQKVQLIKSLIYLNMSPLHKFPFDKLLFYLGKKELSKALL